MQIVRTLAARIVTEACPYLHIGIITAFCRTRDLLDHFPDAEVDAVFIAELRSRIECNGDRIVSLGSALGINLCYDESEDAKALYRALF